MKCGMERIATGAICGKPATHLWTPEHGGHTFLCRDCLRTVACQSDALIPVTDRRWLDDIARMRNCFANETELQVGVGIILRHYGVPHLAEHRFGPGERIDYMIVEPAPPPKHVHKIGLELKVRPNGMAVWRQLQRYADHVDELVLVTTAPLQQVLTLSDTRGRVVPLTTVELWKNP